MASTIVPEQSRVLPAAAECIAAIERDGYCYVPQVFTSEEVSKALELVRNWFDKTVSAQSSRMPFLNRDQPMVYNLQSKDIFFIRLVLDCKLIESILVHFLNDRWFSAIPADAPNYILRSFLARSSNHQMPLHIDSFVPYTGSHISIMQCSIVLEDQTEENGCTVLIPGSHLSGEYCRQEAFQTARPIQARAGDLVFWDSRIWHGARANESGGTRWAVIATFCRWWIKQAFDIPGNLPQEMYDALTDRERAVLGYCSVPYDDEFNGIDMKRGYGLLHKKVVDYRR
jgi:ectoine hydroxylase-related dioxygenase (phytanoyl-CoA dioxygenase family)